ncbi:hypothetical protein D3C74_227640 [compost metagenome]
MAPTASASSDNTSQIFITAFTMLPNNTLAQLRIISAEPDAKFSMFCQPEDAIVLTASAAAAIAAAILAPTDLDQL